MDIPYKGSYKKSNVLSGEKDLVHNINVGNMILKAFKSKPNFIGQINAETEEKTTFQQMREDSVKCALWLNKTCRSIQSTIAICTRCKMLEYIPYLASLYIGAVVNMWDETYLQDPIRTMSFLVKYEPEVIFIDSDNYAQLNSIISMLNSYGEIVEPPKIVTFDTIEGVDSLGLILNNDLYKVNIDQFSCDENNPVDILGTMFSSTATSYMDERLTIRYFACTYPSNKSIPAMFAGDTGLWNGSLNWTHSMILTVRCILSFVTVIKCSNFNGVNIYKTIEKYKVSWVFLDSDMCNQLSETNTHTYDISSLKQLVISNVTVNSNINERLIKNFANASIITVYSIFRGIIVAYQQINEQLGSNSRIAKNVQLMVLHKESKEILGPCEPGEIWYKLIFEWCTPETCRLKNCYNYRAEQDNNEKIKTDRRLDVIDKWQSTEDYGFYEKSGKIYIVDRIKDLIKYQTFYISPTKIETVLLLHPDVSEVVVRSVPHGIDGQHPKAYVKKKSGAQVTENELIKFVADNLPNEYQLRGGVHFKTEMPHLPNGKIDRMLVHSY